VLPDPEPLPEAEPDPEREPEPVGAGGLTLASPLTGPVPEEAGAAGGEGIISALPWSFDEDAPPAPPQPRPEPEPADEPTPAYDTTDVGALRQGAGGETLVVAVQCPDGHANPVHATTCRVCGTHLTGQQPVEVPRPSLGVLRLANGDVVALERGAVLGRNPRLPQGWTGEQPHLVRIDDPDRDVSSQHLEVRLDAWHVLVRDLGSTNGTEVALPGSDPVLLRAHEQLSIEPGTRIVLAGVFDVTYEAGA
jgi:predicted component of type VI protein secretion system